MNSESGYFLATLYNNILPLFAFPRWEVIGAFFIVLILLACSALISGSEVAFFSLSPNDLDQLKQENSKTANRILHLQEMPRTLLATILISNNFINIGIVILSTFILQEIMPASLFEGWAKSLIDTIAFIPWSVETMAWAINGAITVVGVTFLLVLFGEVAPKVYANLNNVKLAKTMARSLTFLNRFFRPVSRILVSWTNLIEKRLASRTHQASLTSKEDIDDAIELTVMNDINAKQEGDILKSIVKFGDVAAKQVMRSRVDVIAVDFRIAFKELVKVVRRSGFSRIPVYDDDFDNITGIFYSKDLIGHLDEDENFEWQSLIRTNVLYVPESKKINDLLKDFQKERLHMAIVVDEYGGSSGIVTLEDILEEVVGEIKDEFDDDSDIDFTKIDDNVYIFEGKTLLNDVCRVVGIDTSTFDEIKEDADTIAGLLLQLTGQIPKINTEINYNQYSFKIVSVNKRRIKQIQITLPKE